MTLSFEFETPALESPPAVSVETGSVIIISI